MDVNEGVINQKSENLDTKTVSLLQTSCIVGDGWVLVATRNKPVEINVYFSWEGGGDGGQNSIEINLQNLQLMSCDNSITPEVPNSARLFTPG